MTAAYGASATAQLTASRSADRPAIVRGLLLLVGGLILIEAQPGRSLPSWWAPRSRDWGTASPSRLKPRHKPRNP